MKEIEGFNPYHLMYLQLPRKYWDFKKIPENPRNSKLPPTPPPPPPPLKICRYRNSNWGGPFSAREESI